MGHLRKPCSFTISSFTVIQSWIPNGTVRPRVTIAQILFQPTVIYAICVLVSVSVNQVSVGHWIMYAYIYEAMRHLDIGISLVAIHVPASTLFQPPVLHYPHHNRPSSIVQLCERTITHSLSPSFFRPPSDERRMLPLLDSFRVGLGSLTRSSLRVPSSLDRPVHIHRSRHLLSSQVWP